MTYNENVENMLRFKSENVVMPSRLHIFVMNYLCFYVKHIGALGENTIFRAHR